MKTVEKKAVRRNDLRTKISKILIKWSMPTRQAAISEIIQLIEDETDNTNESK